MENEAAKIEQAFLKVTAMAIIVFVMCPVVVVLGAVISLFL